MPKGKKNLPLNLDILSERFMFVSDDDGHDYLIPAAKEKYFEEWVAAGPYWEEYDGEDFSDCAIGCSTSQYTFLNPIRSS